MATLSAPSTRILGGGALLAVCALLLLAGGAAQHVNTFPSIPPCACTRPVALDAETIAPNQPRGACINIGWQSFVKQGRSCTVRCDTENGYSDLTHDNAPLVEYQCVGGALQAVHGAVCAKAAPPAPPSPPKCGAASFALFLASQDATSANLVGTTDRMALVAGNGAELVEGSCATLTTAGGEAVADGIDGCPTDCAVDTAAANEAPYGALACNAETDTWSVVTACVAPPPVPKCDMAGLQAWLGTSAGAAANFNPAVVDVEVLALDPSDKSIGCPVQLDGDREAPGCYLDCKANYASYAAGFGYFKYGHVDCDAGVWSAAVYPCSHTL